MESGTASCPRKGLSKQLVCRREGQIVLLLRLQFAARWPAMLETIGQRLREWGFKIDPHPALRTASRR